MRDREKIEWYVRGKMGIRAMGRLLRRNHSVIGRELSRNGKRDGTYSAAYAQMLADRRAVRKGQVKRKLDRLEDLQTHVIKELRDGKSPDVIAGRLKVKPPPHLTGVSISHEAIYQWLYEGTGHDLQYWRLLFSARPGRRGRGTRHTQGTSRIIGRTSIRERDAGAEGRLILGHWETDSMVFKRGFKQRLSVQTERKARLVRIHRLPSGSAQDTLEAIRDSIASVPQDAWKTITFDNGTEGSQHAFLTHDYGIRTFFCDPYSSWQKGSVENANRIIRRYLPRSTDLSALSDHQLHAIQEKINDTPRKILNYRTPNEVFASEVG